MNKELSEYIILRSQTPVVPSTANVGTRGASSFSLPDEMELTQASLTKAERNDLRRDPRTKAVAPPMPMKLMEPVESEEVNQPEDRDATWGIKAVRADESPFDGSGITVAVLDTGIDPDHAAFKSVNIEQRNFTDEDDNDLNGHGTHCAGTIFGQDIERLNLRIGVARNIERALIAKVLGKGGGSSRTIAQAIQWAVAEGANVISMSLGIDFPGHVELLTTRGGLDIKPATSRALEDYRANVNLFSALSDFINAQNMMLSNFGESKGTIVVAASGNESARPEYEISVAPPAAGSGILAVGALGQSSVDGLSVAHFSNNEVNLSAPGVRVLSAFPGGKMRSLSGTSMATPHVAGVAALWAQKQLERTSEIDSTTLMARVIASGDMSRLTPDSEAEDVGTGIVQAPLR